MLAVLVTFIFVVTPDAMAGKRRARRPSIRMQGNGLFVEADYGMDR
jgi:hypothetical protein